MKSNIDRLLARIALLLTSTLSSSEGTTIVQSHSYTIKDARESESAWILFAEDDDTGQPVVIKLLRPCHDNRYKLAELLSRQTCQLEALQWNSLFTPGVYIGLASVYGLDCSRRKLLLGEVVENVEHSNRLDSGVEYALLMHQLPRSRQLDQLIRRMRSESYGEHVQRVSKVLHLLTKYISHMQQYKAPLIERSEKEPYGSPVQIRGKLAHILEDVDKVLDELRKYPMISSYKHWESILEGIREQLPEIIKLNRYQKYFEQRVQEGRIRRCHGDLKTSNIWIMPSKTRSAKRFWQDIQVLDTIDFNSLYCNIDILSDFAMLAVDIEARGRSPLIVRSFVEEYLAVTGQQDAVSRAVLAYYLVEKAVVCASVSILHDKELEPGLALLKVAEICMNELVELVASWARVPDELYKEKYNETPATEESTE